MLNLEAAQKQVLALCEKLEPKMLPLADASGCVIAEKVMSTEPVPAFDNTAMDGFAVKAADTKNPPAKLKIVGDLIAGDPFNKVELEEGQAIRIMTGAPIPMGADAIIEVEKTEVDGDLVSLKTGVEKGNFIRKIGENIQPGQKIISKEKILTPARLGVLASQGRYEVLAYPKCKVGVLSTGSELVEDEDKLTEGKIRDSNRHILLSLIQNTGMEAIDFGIIQDTEKDILKAMKAASKYCNALITSGGVSMGDFDFVKKILTSEGFDGANIQVAIKPSKPLAFGRLGNMMIFGLPGNPVSALVSFELFALPGLNKMMGIKTIHKPKIDAIAKEDMSRSPDGKIHFVRVKWKFKDGNYEVRPIKAQGSHQLQGLAEANGLAILEDGKGIKSGDSIKLICLD